jgi:endonuclease III-like uncharacterized protein
LAPWQQYDFSQRLKGYQVFMTELSRLAKANALLRAAYGSPELSVAGSSWTLFLQVLLVGPGTAASGSAVSDVLNSQALGDPETTMQTGTGELVELLAKVPRGSQKASLLRTVADWWLKTFGNECSPEWSHGLEHYRLSLRKIRGLGPATVDDLLMHAARLAVFPLDRGTLRVAIRHGWLDLPVEDDESQSFFVGGLKEAGIDTREFSLLISRVAEENCGREPKCEGCPLQSLLPPGGPLNPDSC